MRMDDISRRHLLGIAGLAGLAPMSFDGPHGDAGGHGGPDATEAPGPGQPAARSEQTQVITGRFEPGAPDQIAKEVVQERYQRLAALQEQISWAENSRQVGRVLDVLVAEGEGRKDQATRRLSGRAGDNRLVHFAPGGDTPPRPGDLVTVEVTQAAPFHLVADGPLLGLRRTRAGDAWQARTVPPAPTGVLLGLPGVGRPAATAGSGGPVQSGCGGCG